jgi:DNA-binding NarL/FixJ family response regulator
MPGRMKIFIVEDHPIFRMGLQELIDSEPDMEVCGSAGDVNTAVSMIEKIVPDLVIVDLSLKDSSGMDLIKYINDHAPDTGSLVLSMHDESVHAKRCIMAGAGGYIMKQEASESVVTAIRHILAGHIHVSRKIMTRILDAARNQDTAFPDGSPLRRLTDREREIFQYIGRGYSSGKIAKILHISVKTIGTHRERIKEKLGFRHSGELVRNAVIWVETGKMAL